MADLKQSEWGNRYQSYVLDRNEISNIEGLSTEDKLKEIIILKQSNFSKQERIRIETLDRISNNSQ